mmetsp:Transcript_88699/g.251471  ORF Transcript_88699/g.251471 Transcript_88699/m.251471 type:complete len:857 (-) Transcript_88699:301-2871(-)
MRGARGRRPGGPGLLPGLCLLALAGPARCSTEYAPVDTSLIAELIANMTLAEKLEETCASGCTGAQMKAVACPFHPLLQKGAGVMFNMRDNARLGIRGMRMRDGPRGITCVAAGMLRFGSPCPWNATTPAFPTESLRAASWDVALEEEVGRAVGEIANALDVHAALLPSINILPWLNWGRGQESFGEDPVLNGKMGAATVRGVQSQGVMATVKHFLANNVEIGRWYLNADLSDKTLHEVYLKAWSIVVAESSPELVMTSYNRVQGDWANTNPKFIDILRDRLGFEGSVMTDWLATFQQSVGSSPVGPFYWEKNSFGKPSRVYKAGVDMEMPWCNQNMKAVRELASCSVDNEEACATENALDRNVAHVLRSKMRYGLMGTSPTSYTRASFDIAKYDGLALKVAQQSIVLLRNEASFLPKRPSEVASVVVMGTPDVLELGDKGSSFVKPYGRTATVLEALQEKYGTANVEYIRRIRYRRKLAIERIKNATMVVLDVGFSHKLEGEYLPGMAGGDRLHLSLEPADITLIANTHALNPNVVVALTSGQNVLVEDFVHLVKAILWMGYPGPLGGQAFADILAGDTNPSGRMPSVTPKTAADYLPEGTVLMPWAGYVNVTYPHSHGFKHMWGAGVEPRYPLGWGLSYTAFSHSRPVLRAGAGELALAVSTTVANTGDRPGIETIQVYGRCEDCRRARLPIVLLGFAKAHLQAGAQQKVEVLFSAKDLAVYNAPDPNGEWLLEKGNYTILVGPCANASLLKGVNHRVESDIAFNYPGAASPPHVPAVGARKCNQYSCQRAPDFVRNDWYTLITSAIENYLVIGSVILMCYLCCCFRGCCMCCRRAGCCRCPRCACCRRKAKAS